MVILIKQTRKNCAYRDNVEKFKFTLNKLNKKGYNKISKLYMYKLILRDMKLTANDKKEINQIIVNKINSRTQKNTIFYKKLKDLLDTT